MNIFYLDEDPHLAATMVCDSHASKMCVESVQMLVSALLINGANPDDMPLTKSTEQPHKGGYKHHPSTRWTATSLPNWIWLFNHAHGLCDQFHARFGGEHFARRQLDHLMKIAWSEYLPILKRTPIARAFNQSKGLNLDLLDYVKYTDVEAYRQFYIRDKSNIAKWEKGVAAPDWWVEAMEVTA